MRKGLGLASAMAVVFAVASTAGASPLNWAGTLSFGLGTLPTSTITGGGVATVNGSSGTLPAHLGNLRLAASRGNVTGTGTALVTDPDTYVGINAVVIEARPGTGTIGPVSGAVAPQGAPLTMNVMPLGGLARVCLLDLSCTPPNVILIPLTQPTPMGGVKGIGVGGQIVGIGGNIRISIEAAPWTVKTATAIDQTDDNTGAAAFHNVTRMGFAHGPASGTTSTAQPSGVLQLVTPSQVRTNLPLGSNVKLSVLTELLIHFIPEPGLLLLLGSGVVGLALIGRSRMKK